MATVAAPADRGLLGGSVNPDLSQPRGFRENTADSYGSLNPDGVHEDLMPSSLPEASATVAAAVPILESADYHIPRAAAYADPNRPRLGSQPSGLLNVRMQGQAVNLTPQQVVARMGGVAKVYDELAGEMRTVELATDRPPVVEHKTSEPNL